MFPWFKKTDASLSLNSGGIGFLSAGMTFRWGNVLKRLGDVLYWVGCILAASVVVWGVHEDDPYIFALAVVGAFSIWTIGRAWRYILSGK
jgi:hypothetical protein